MRGAAKRAATLREFRALAELFRDLATLRTTVPVFDAVEELRWRGPVEGWDAMCERLGTPGLRRRVEELGARRQA